MRSTLRQDFKLQKIIRVKVNDETWNTHKWFGKPRLSRNRTQRHSATGPLRQLAPGTRRGSIFKQRLCCLRLETADSLAERGEF